MSTPDLFVSLPSEQQAREQLERMGLELPDKTEYQYRGLLFAMDVLFARTNGMSGPLMFFSTMNQDLQNITPREFLQKGGDPEVVIIASQKFRVQ